MGSWPEGMRFPDHALPYDMADGGPSQKAQLLAQREAAEIGFHRAQRESRLLGIIDPHADDDGRAGTCDFVGLADHAGNRRIVVHRQVSRAGPEGSALGVAAAAPGAWPST